MVGVALWFLLNWSYTTAVFTDPGSPLNDPSAYQALAPSDDTDPQTSFTVKSTGETRFCKKCCTRKPDRAHHCSTCGRCVLKMVGLTCKDPAHGCQTDALPLQDHHCPWLATCVGLYNYKAFLLFLIYTTLFCWICFAVSLTWVWQVVLNDVHFEERLMPINYILLTALGGIIGLVLSGFTGWHVYLALNGQTTIESLEKTRYLAPVRAAMRHRLHDRQHADLATGDPSPSLGDRLLSTHVNALPGVLRPEEGTTTTPTTTSTATTSRTNSPAHASLRDAYASTEAQRDRDRYAEYLDEQDLERLPNAFDLGWRRNMRHVFGARPSLWFVPLRSTSGDGWSWEPSSRWLEAREELARERERREQEDVFFERQRGWERGAVVDFRGGGTATMRAPPPPPPPPPPPKPKGIQATGKEMPTDHALRVRSPALSETNEPSDNENESRVRLLDKQRIVQAPNERPTSNWNDLPDGFLDPRGGVTGKKSSGARGRG